MATIFKLVAMYDEQKGKWKALDHNLSLEDAEEMANVLYLQEVPGIVLSQRVQHSATDAETCRACAARVRLYPKPEQQKLADRSMSEPPAPREKGGESDGVESQTRDDSRQDK